MPSKQREGERSAVLETELRGHAKDIERLENALNKLGDRVTNEVAGLREDMAERSETWIKGQAEMQNRFTTALSAHARQAQEGITALKLSVAKLVGIGIGASTLISALVGLADLYYRAHEAPQPPKETAYDYNARIAPQ